MRGIKIPQQDFALKSQGELMCEGGVFAGHYGTSHTEVRQTKSFYITHLVCALYKHNCLSAFQNLCMYTYLTGIALLYNYS